MPKKPAVSAGTHVAADLIGSDYALPGTLASRYMRCGKTNCRCKAESPVLHGTYLHWTRTVAGKTVTRTLTPEQAERYQPCLLYTSPSPRDRQKSRMPSSA